MTKTRAQAGGEIGINGEHYRGGAFLPKTRLPKQGTPTRRVGGGRGLVAPGEIADIPDGHRAIFASVAALSRMISGQLVPFSEDHPVWGFHDRAKVERLCAAWNRGERTERICA